MFGKHFCVTLNKSHHWLVALTLKVELFSTYKFLQTSSFWGMAYHWAMPCVVPFNPGSAGFEAVLLPPEAPVLA